MNFTVPQNTILTKSDVDSYEFPEELFDNTKNNFEIYLSFTFHQQAQNFLDKQEFGKAKIAEFFKLASFRTENQVFSFNPYGENGKYVLNTFSKEEFDLVKTIVDRENIPVELSLKVYDFFVCCKKERGEYIEKLLGITKEAIIQFDELDLSILNSLFRIVEVFLNLKEFEGAKKFTSLFLEKFKNLDVNKGFYYKFIAEKMRKLKLNYDHDLIANSLEKLGDEFLILNADSALRYYEETISQLGNKNPLKKNAVLLKMAEIYYGKTESETAFAKGLFWNNALKCLRKIPQKNRDESISAMLKDIEDKIQKNHSREMEEATKFEEKIDISEAVDFYRRKIESQKSEFEAYLEFFTSLPVLDLSSLDESVQNDLRSFVCGSQIIKDSYGNNVAIYHGEEIKEHEKIKCFIFHCSFFAMGKIFTQLKFLQEKCPQDLQSLEFVVGESIFVPKSLIHEWVLVIFYGIKGDFFVAMQILAPLLENTCRLLLKKEGEITIQREQNGIERELNLGKLLEIQKMKDVFGELNVFYLKNLYCNPAASNIRNDVAHGILNINSSKNPLVVFAWWFTIRQFVFVPYFQNVFSDKK